MILDSRIPGPVEPILKNYILLTEKRFGGLVDAFYLLGTLALNEFNENFSDIDFVAVLHRKAIPLELEQLRKIHRSIEKSYSRWTMSGRYVQANDLGKPGKRLAPHPQVHDGVFHAGMANIINSVTMIVLYSDWGLQWAVLGVLRQFSTCRENSISTKMRAGAYALGYLPQQWHQLGQEAINIRQGNKNSSYRFRFGRTVEAVNFLNYIINTCNANSFS